MDSAEVRANAWMARLHGCRCCFFGGVYDFQRSLARLGTGLGSIARGGKPLDA